MLKLPQLAVNSELQVLLAVERWAKFQNQGRPLGPFISLKLLGPCLQHVRFLALTPTQFSEHVAKSGLLSIEDCLVVLVNLNSPGQMPLPEHLSKDDGKRCDGNSAPELPPPQPMQRPVAFEGAKKLPAKLAALPERLKAESNVPEEKVVQKEPKKEEAKCQGMKLDVKIEEKQPKPKPFPAPMPAFKRLSFADILFIVIGCLLISLILTIKVLINGEVMKYFCPINSYDNFYY